MSLYDWAKLSNSAMAMKLAKSIYAGDMMIKYFKFRTDPSLKVQGRQLTHAGLPPIGWRKLNEQSEATKGKTRAVEAELHIIANDLEFDVAELRAYKAGKLITDPVAEQFSMWQTALDFEIEDVWFNANPALVSYEDCPAGLKTMLDNPTQYKLDPNSKSQTPTINLSTGGLSANAALILCGEIDKKLFWMGSREGQNCVISMDYQLVTNWVTALQMGRMFSIEKDQFGNDMLKYKKAIVQKVGWKADGSTPVISATETVTGASGGTVYTSAYITNTDPEALDVFQPQTLVPEMQGQIGSKKMAHIEWGMGRLAKKERAFARLTGIQGTNS